MYYKHPDQQYANESNHYRTTQMIRWVSITICSMVAVICCAAAVTTGPVAARVACFPYVYTCTTVAETSYYNKGNTTCRCEALPEDRK